MKFHDEFPSYRIEDMPKAIRDAVNEGWVADTSWHNDAMPSFECNGLRLWTDFKDKPMREFPEGKRFSLSRVDDDSNEPVSAFEDEGSIPCALELMKLAGEDVKTLEPDALICRLVTIVGLGFHLDNAVGEYELGFDADVQAALQAAVMELGYEQASEIVFSTWRERGLLPSEEKP